MDRTCGKSGFFKVHELIYLSSYYSEPPLRGRGDPHLPQYLFDVGFSPPHEHVILFSVRTKSSDKSHKAGIRNNVEM
jgi:hypothetical protein